jgi:hypothetical protein
MVQVTQDQLKMTVIGLIPVFFIISVFMPRTFTTDILLGLVVLTALVISFIGWSMEKREKGSDEDLLAIPPKRS